MADRQLPSIDLLRQLLRYEPDTGKLYWRERGVELFVTQRAFNTWNARYAGKEAFTGVNKHGYLIGSVFDSLHRAHRVIWAMVYGEWPDDQIDHINGIRSDNRISNLREATNAQNRRNSGERSDNTSGFTGVYWDRDRQKWMAQIGVNGTRKKLGRFDSPEEAYAAYCAAADRLHGEFASTR